MFDWLAYENLHFHARFGLHVISLNISLGLFFEAYTLVPRITMIVSQITTSLYVHSMYGI